jgi:hypothetical protein
VQRFAGDRGQDAPITFEATAFNGARLRRVFKGATRFSAMSAVTESALPEKRAELDKPKRKVGRR